MRYSLVKVLLIVSPFPSSFSPALNPFSRSPRALTPLSTAFLPRAKPRSRPTRTVSPLFVACTPNRSLTPLSTAFTQKHQDVRVSLSYFVQAGHGSRITSHVFSYYCGLFVALAALFATPILYFQQLARSFAKTPGGVGGTGVQTYRRSDLETFLRPIRRWSDYVRAVRGLGCIGVRFVARFGVFSLGARGGLFPS
jgi:hypothetical protein